MKRWARVLSVMLALIAVPGLARDQAPLRAGIDPSFPPHAMAKLGGGVEGFQIDLVNEVARRLRRGLILESARFSALIPFLLADRYDFAASPVVVTPDRAETMLFTQPYLAAEFQFGIRIDSPVITGWADLRGKTVVVVRNTAYDSLAQTMAEPHGLLVRPVATTDEAARIVAAGQAHAFLAGKHRGSPYRPA